jgi:type II secretory pathway pseudopilin PulG
VTSVTHLGRRLNRSETGDTLIELLIAIVIIALTVTALLGALVTSLTSSATQESLSTVDSVLNSFAQSAQYEAQQAFVTCTPTPYRLVSAPMPAAGPVGTSVVVFVTGFAANHGLTVTIGTSTITGPTTDGNGDATVTFAVPGGVAGTAQNVSVSDGVNTSSTPTPFVVGGTTKGTAPVRYSILVNPVQQWDAQGSTWVATTSGTCPNSGAQQITAIAQGPNGVSGSLSFVVLHSATTTVLVTAKSSSPVPTLGDMLTFTATVIPPNSTTPYPAGSIQWSFTQSPNAPSCQGGNTSTLGQLLPSNTSQAQCIVSPAAVGSYEVTATYPAPGSTGNNYGQGNGTASITVQAARSSTTVAGSASPTPAQPGSTLTFKATIGASPAINTDPQPTGAVVWTVTAPSGPNPSCSGAGGDTVQMTGNGTGTNSVTCTVTLPNTAPTGTYSASASYAGDGNYFSSATGSPTTISVSKATPSLSYSTTPQNPQPGSSFTVKVTVNGNATITPSGTITWTITPPSGTSPACTGPNPTTLNAGIATCTVSLPSAAPTGAYTVGVSYSGDTAYVGVAGSTMVNVTLAPAGFNIQTVGNPANNRPDNGDQIIYTYNQVMAPGSIMNGLNLNQPVTVTAVFSRQTGATSLTIQCTGFRCSNPNLGTVSLGDSGSSRYVGGFGSISLSATMVMTTNASGQSVVTITLTQSSASISTVSGNTALVWTPSSSATNTATPPVPSATTPVNEVGAPKANF